MHPVPSVPSVRLWPAAAGPRLRATVLLQQEPGKDAREAWSTVLAFQVTILAAVFGGMVAFAPEQLRVEAERRRTDCVRLPLLRDACVPIVENGLLPIEPLRLRGGFAPRLRRRAALTAAGLSLSLSLVGHRPAKAAPVWPAAGPISNGATPPAPSAPSAPLAVAPSWRRGGWQRQRPPRRQRGARRRRRWRRRRRRGGSKRVRRRRRRSCAWSCSNSRRRWRRSHRSYRRCNRPYRRSSPRAIHTYCVLRTPNCALRTAQCLLLTAYCTLLY